MMNQGATMGNSASEDAKPNSTSSMPSPSRDKNGCYVSITGNRIDRNIFSDNKADDIATVAVYPSQGPNEEKQGESSGEADTQSSSDDKRSGSKTKKGKNGYNVSINENNFTGNTFSNNKADNIATVAVYPSQGPNEEK